MKKIVMFVALLLVAGMAAFAQDAKRYEIKSGIITMTSEMGSSTIYFDNYGAVQAQKMNMMGNEMIILNKDGKTYMINPGEKQVQEMPGGGMGGPTINFLALTDKVKADNKIQELGKEKVLDRECTKYSIETSMMGQTMKQTVWVWKGITLKTAMDGGQFSFENAASKFEENAKMPEGIFEVPKY